MNQHEDKDIKKPVTPPDSQTPKGNSDEIKKDKDHETFGNEPTIKEPNAKDQPERYEVKRTDINN